MTEREVHFTENERLGIQEAARGVAAAGEECVWTNIHAKNKLMQFVIQSKAAGQPITFELDGQKLTLTSEEIRHEVDIMEEVIKQSQLLLQLEGRDTMSELDRAAQSVGWGSIYDPDSKIFKSLGGFRD